MLQKGGLRRGSHQRLPSSSVIMPTTMNDTIDSAGDFEDDDDEDEEPHESEPKTVRLEFSEPSFQQTVIVT